MIRVVFDLTAIWGMGTVYLRAMQRQASTSTILFLLRARAFRAFPWQTALRLIRLRFQTCILTRRRWCKRHGLLSSATYLSREPQRTIRPPAAWASPTRQL